MQTALTSPPFFGFTTGIIRKINTVEGQYKNTVAKGLARMEWAYEEKGTHPSLKS